MDDAYLICDAFFKLNNITTQGFIEAAFEYTSRGPCFIEATAHSSTVCETSADDSRDGWNAPAKVRDSRGAQWTYFPSTISGSNVPEGGWLFTLEPPTACNVVVYIVLYIQPFIL